MGAVTVIRHYPACSTAELRVHYQDEMEEMERENGSNGYGGNWHGNSGLHVSDKQFNNDTEARAYLERVLEKRGRIIAVKVGDFNKAWPETKAQKALVEKSKALETEYREFEYRILERAHKQKSKTKKCPSCESGINVHAIPLPKLSELTEDTGSIRFSGGSLRFMGRFMRAMHYGLTDCPVCCKNLLKTATDIKNEASLKKRVAEASAKMQTEKAAYEKAKVGKSQAHWVVGGECAE